MSSPLAATLEGRHVTLTPLTLDDVDGLLAAADEDRSTYGWTVVPDTPDTMREYVAAALTDQSNRVTVPFVTHRRSTGAIIGATRFLNLRWWGGRNVPDAVEIGATFLAASAQRTQVNTEAKLLMLTHAFDVWGVRRLELITDERNERSRQAIERLGATFDGVLRSWQPSRVIGEEDCLRNTAMYSILAPEWPAIRTRLIDRLTDD
jgi:RimJ/RimL family protein N-acetyltransferase